MNLRITQVIAIAVLLSIMIVPHQKKPLETVHLPPVVILVKKKIPTISLGLRSFLHRMAQVESDNNPRATNRFGMLGKYQFHPSTIRSLGVYVSREEFLSNEVLQDSVMIRYMKDNAVELRPIIRKFSGTIYNGIPITKSGIVASAHLTGTMGVLAFFYPEKYSHRTHDANGTSIEMYMRQFENYNLGF